MKYGKLDNGKLVNYKPGGLELNNYIIYNPTQDQFKQAGYYPIVEIAEDGEDKIENETLLHYIGYENGLQLEINKKLKEIEQYDVSSEVNGFYLGEMNLWIPRETRVSLQNSTSILLKNGITSTTLWEGPMHFELPCELLLQMLDSLEIYALRCFNKTAEHKAAVMQMTSIENVKNYNFTEGYPEKLHFNL